jgi:hypothetical protein
MVMDVIVKSYPVDIMTAHYRVYGEIRTRGDPVLFLNDQNVSTLTVYDATLMPLRQGMRLGAVSTDELHVPKHEPQVIILGNFIPETRPLPKTERLICFTDTYILRGTFHMSVETKVHDVFYAQPGPFFAVTRLDIHALYPLAVEVKANAELAYLRGAAVRAFYHLAEED